MNKFSDFIKIIKRDNYGAILYLLIYLAPLILIIIDFKIMPFKNVINSNTFFILKNSFIQSFLSVLFSILVVLPAIIYLLTNKNFLTILLESLIFVPFFFPPISLGIGMFYIFKIFNINYSLIAIIISHIFYNSPIILKYTYDSIKNIDNNLIEASKIDGASEKVIFLKIILPQALTGIFRGIFLAFLYCWTSFAIIMIVGNMKWNTLELSIYYSISGELNIENAINYSIIQFLIISLINFFTINFNTGEQNYEKKYQIKNGKIISLIFSIFYLIFEYGIILFVIFNSFSLPVLIKLFSKEFNKLFPIVLSIINSLFFSLIVSFFIVVISYLLLVRRNKINDLIILFSFGFSSSIIGLFMYYLHIVYNIPILIVAISGLILLTVPIAYSYLYHSMVTFPSDIVDNSKIDGLNIFQFFKYIHFPILKKPFVTTFIQIFIIIYGEFTILFITRINKFFPIVSVTNFEMIGKRYINESLLFSGINVLIIITIFVFTNIVISKIDNET